jgi:hypothetical protein
VPKSQQQLDTQEKVRAATIKSINDRTKFVNENSDEWGARKLSNGRVEVGGPTLPLQFDHFVQVPEWLRSKAREFEAGRTEGRSYLYSYNAIGTGEAGSYKIKNLGNVEAKTGEMVPFGWAVSTKNHLLAKVIDLNSFRAAAIRAIDNEQLGEFGNDLRAVETGLKQLLSNYENGVAGETGLGVTRKNILNGLLGTGTVVQKASNPVWHTLNNQGSVRTFRFDRLNYADPHGTGYFPHYNKININALPDDAGRMSLDQYGQFDADRKAAWMNKEAVKRGFSNATNWQNADAQGFQAADGQYRQQFPAGGAAQRGSAMPDVAVVPERFTGSGDEAGRRSRFVPPPAFFNRFAIESYERGGKFFDASTGDDLTGKTFSSGFIDVSTGKPRLFVDSPSSDIGIGNTYRTNLFKQRAGWKWISDNAPETSTIVSVEGGGRHVYSLRSDFGGGVALARYSDKASEPRLRPTAKGDLVLGQEVGRISIRGKEHPVYDSVRVQSRAPSGQGARGQALPDNEGANLGQRRAKAGGEYGENGEWYEGGKFIANTDTPKGQAVRRLKTGKREIAPYVWTVQPSPDHLAIYPTLSGVEIFNRGTGRFEFNSNLRSYFASPEAVMERRARIDAYNSGKRWFTNNEDGIKFFEDTSSGRPEGGARTRGQALPDTDGSQQTGYDNTYLKQALAQGSGGMVKLTRPIKPNEALPLLSQVPQITERASKDSFTFDRPALVEFYTNQGQPVAFKWDPDVLVRPQFKDIATEHAGKPIQLAMADRQQAVGGDMGGVMHTYLKSLREVPIQDPLTGRELIPVWANNEWKPAKAMKGKAARGAKDLLVYLMGETAHGSNLRTVRRISNEIDNAPLAAKEKDVFLIIANKGVKQARSREYQAAIKSATIKADKLKERLKSSDSKDKVSINKQLSRVTRSIDDARAKLPKYKISPEEEEFAAVVTTYRNAGTRYRNGTGTLEAFQMREEEFFKYLDGFKRVKVEEKQPNGKTREVYKYKPSGAFKKLESSIHGKHLIKLDNTFDGRKAAVEALLGLNIKGFNVDHVLPETADFQGGRINHIVSSVELSTNPDLGAVYLGDDPQQAKFMTPLEADAAKKIKASNKYVVHEAYSWVMLGPKDGNHFLNSSPKTNEDYFPWFRQRFADTKADPVKRDNILTASDTSLINTMRDQTLFPLVMPAK